MSSRAKAGYLTVQLIITFIGKGQEEMIFRTIDFAGMDLPFISVTLQVYKYSVIVHLKGTQNGQRPINYTDMEFAQPFPFTISKIYDNIIYAVRDRFYPFPAILRRAWTLEKKTFIKY